MTDNEIIKAFECLLDKMRAYECEQVSIGKGLILDVLDLIKSLQAEKDYLFLTLSGVMHFVDKWLDGGELNQVEVNRAMTMREKTLEITERQAEQIEELIAGQETLQKCIAEKDKQIKYLIKQRDRAFLESRRIVRRNGELRDEINANKKSKAEAIKEFAKRLKATKAIHYCKCGRDIDITDPVNSYIDTVAVELGG